jgi:hypothetical protein
MIRRYATPRFKNLLSAETFKTVNFLYCLAFVSVPLALVAFLGQIGPLTWESVAFYAGMAVASAVVIFVVRSLVSGIFDIKLSYKPWLPGLVFSVIATLIISVIAGIPVPIPLMNASEYKRAVTLRGMKKGEIRNKDKWETSMFSFLAILAFAQLFLAFSSVSKNAPLFYSGILLIMYVIVDMIPTKMFNGAFMVYYNYIFYFISAGFIILLLILAYLDRVAGLFMFFVFLIASLISYKVKLW